MRAKIDHGGFAFPTQAICTPAGDVMSSGDDGMSLRDWFAGKALVGLTTANPSAHLGINPGYAKHVAEACFVLADAMIAAGKVKSDPDSMKPARELTDAEISTELFQLGQQVAEGFGEHGGSPGEWIYERRDELSTEQDRRAARKAGA